MTDNLQTVLTRIRRAESAAGRPAGSVRLLAASKAQSAEQIRFAHSQGQTCFGENYLQEALEKMQKLQYIKLEWHFIGALQSRKAKSVAEHFAWVQSVDSLKLAQRLSAARPAALGPLNICLQVNISREPQKAGILLEDLPALAQAVLSLPNLRLRGLMAIPAPRAGPEVYQLLKEACDRLQLDTLSVGMSEDLELAIEQGATLVRIGTAIFGARTSCKTLT